MALVLLTGLVYAHVLGGAFIWDDEYLYFDNPSLLRGGPQASGAAPLESQLGRMERGRESWVRDEQSLGARREAITLLQGRGPEAC